MLDVHSTLRSIHVALYLSFLIHPLFNSHWIHIIPTTKIIILYMNSSILNISFSDIYPTILIVYNHVQFDIDCKMIT